MSVVYQCAQCQGYETSLLFAFNVHVKRCQKLSNQFICENGPETYKCQECNFETSTKVSHENHFNLKRCRNEDGINEHEELKCERCNFITFSKYFLQVHQSRIDCWSTVTSDGKIKCKVCETTFRGRHNFKNHVQYKHSCFINITNEIFQCSCCSYVSSKRIHLVSHFMRSHTDPDQMKWFKCAQCSFTPKTKLDMKDHIFGKIGSCSNKKTEKGWLSERITSAGRTCKYLFKCKYCSFTTEKYKRIKYHIDEKHLGCSKSQCYDCKLCSKTFRSRSNFISYEEHVCDSINHIKWYKCDHCDYKTLWSTSLKNHLVQHVPPKEEFICDKCSYKTHWKNNMKRHLRSHHPDNWHKCDYCDYKSMHKRAVNTHMLQHEPSDDRFVCDKCSFKTSREAYLKRHWRVNHSDNWHKCAHCNFRTRLKYILNGHINSKHSRPENIIWLECPHCSYKCKHPSNLYTHKRKFHT